MNVNGKLLEVGQVWSVAGATEKGTETVKFLKIERMETLEIVHVSLADINGDVSIEHLPFTATAIQNSVTSLIGTEEVGSDHLAGYEYWKAEYLAGRAGVFSVPISQAVILLDSDTD